MKKLQCELCDSIEIVKIDDDMFQCQYCGCKYTREQARSLISGTVTAKQPDFVIRAGVLVKYNGEAVDVTIPSNVTHIGHEAFRGCVGLKSVVIPEGVIGIGIRAFSGCESLTKIVIPAGITEIEGYVFDDCKSLESVTIPSTVQKIKSSAFSYCHSLKSIRIPKSVSSIEVTAFSHCPNLISVVFEEDSKFVYNEDRGYFLGCKALDSQTVCAQNRRARGVCQHCGGAFELAGLVKKKVVCSNCGKRKDYV